MSRSFSLLVPCAFVAAFVTFGCEPADPDDGNDGDASCAEVCGVLMASECFYGGGEADCNTSCEGWDSQTAASSLIGCPEAWIDYKECMAAASVDNCGGVASSSGSSRVHVAGRVTSAPGTSVRPTATTSPSATATSSLAFALRGPCPDHP